MTRWRWRLGSVAICLAGIPALLAAGASAQGESATQPIATKQSPDEAAPGPQVTQPPLADRLTSDDPGLRSKTIRDLLTGLQDGSETAPTVLDRQVLDALAAISIDADDADANSAIRVLGFSSSRFATQSLIVLIDPAWDDERRRLAFRTLAMQTGRDEMGQDLRAWTAWWQRAQWLTEGEWRAELTHNLARRARRMQSERDALERRVVDLSTSLYTVSSLDTRSQRLLEMLNEPMAALRLAGINLAEKELLNARQLSPEVGSLAVKLLEDSDARIRERAAALLVRLNVVEAPPAAYRALRIETDASVAASLLLVASKAPTLEGVLMAVDWIRASENARAAGSEMIHAAWREGVLTDPIGRLPALDALRSIPVEDLSASAIRVRIEAGDGADRAALRPLLESSNQDQKITVASALGRWPDSFDWVIQAAATDSSLRPAAIRSIMAHRPGLEGWRLAESLPPDEGRDLEWRQQFAEAMPPQELATVVRGINDPQMIISMLSHLSDSREGITQRVRGELLTTLARAYLAIGDASSAHETISQVVVGATSPETIGLRLRSLLLLGRLEEASQLSAAPNVWIAALSENIANESSHAVAIRDLIVDRFGETLTPSQRDELATANEALAQRTTEDGEKGEESAGAKADGEDPGA